MKGGIKCHQFWANVSTNGKHSTIFYRQLILAYLAFLLWCFPLCVAIWKLVSFSLLPYLLKLIFEKSILRQMYLSWNFSHWNMDPPWNVEVRRTFLSQRQTPLSMKFILIRQVSTPLLANILDVLTTSYLTQLGMAMLIRNLPQQVFWHCAVHLVPSGQPFLWRTLQNSTLEKTERKKENRWKMCSRVREVSWNGEH